MKIRFVRQPIEGGLNLKGFLISSLGNEALSRLDIAVAWVTRSAIASIRKGLSEFRQRGGMVRLVVGIDEGGTTRQGLESALEETDETYVYHVPGSRIFHPKVFAAYGPDEAAVLIGSHNFTRGGMEWNFEASVAMELDLQEQRDSDFLSEVIEQYVDRLVADTGACVPLSGDTISALCDSPRYQIRDEDEDGLGKRRNLAARDGTGLFSTSRLPLRSPGQGRPEGANGSGQALLENARGFDGTIQKRWYKKLFKADAQRPGSGTNPTGHVTLTKNHFPIDHSVYFRQELFGGMPWVSAGESEGREKVTIPFDVTIQGEHLGEQPLVVDYNPQFESNQGNRTTVLHWNQRLNEYLRSNNLVGLTITIERLMDDRFNLVVAEEPAGGFIY